MTNPGPANQSTDNITLLTTGNFSQQSLAHAAAHAVMGVNAIARNTCVLLGDSRNDQATSGGAIVNGLTRTKTALSWFNWYNALNNQPLQLVAKFAISGSQTSSVYDTGSRAAGNAPADQVASVLALNPLPQFAFIWSGINDLSNTVLPIISFANIKNGCLALLNAGITPVVFLESGSTNLNTATLIARLFEYNERLRGLGESNPQIFIFDAAAPMWDPTGAAWTATPAVVFKTGYSLDGTHPTNLAGNAIGVAFGSWFGTPTKGVESRPATFGEFIFANNPLDAVLNGLFTTTTGGATSGAGTLSSGTVPANWTLNLGAAGSTSTLSTAAGVAGNVLTNVITVTGATILKLQQDAPTAAKNAAGLGDIFQCGWELTVTAGTNLQGINVIHEYNDGTNTFTYYDMYCQASAANGPQAFTVQCQPLPMTLTSLPASGWITTRIEIVFSGAGGATVGMGRVRNRKRLL
jgi:hypothetical protein